ncbi:MAG: prepilin-type N-terminal cleavage/methylation domain-containing protein [Verrucomicrobiae bacterium]|nr:prepilin-type N-terminal cleavage/methylation domain-containing protein [Verrucomicrobiae bacterium]
MKTFSEKRKISGFTLLEVLVVLGILFLLAAMLMPVSNRRVKAIMPQCLSHLKQIELGLQMYMDDNHGKSPAQLSMTNGFTLDWINRGKVFPHFQKLSPYLSRNPGLLICPADVEKQAATNFETLNDSNISYFLNLDVSTNQPERALVAGDRNLEALNQPVRPGLFELTTNVYGRMRWADSLHKRRGCLVFEDGHAAVNINLNAVIQDQPLATNRLCVP